MPGSCARLCKCRVNKGRSWLEQRALSHQISKTVGQMYDTCWQPALGFLQLCPVVREGVCLCGCGCRWQERERWVGEKALVSGACVGLYASMFVSVTSSTCLKALSGFPLHAGWRLNSLTWPMRPCVPIPPPGLCTHCTLYLLHSPRSSPITLHGLYSYPVFLEPHPRLGQTAPTLTGFPRSLSWAITDISVWSARVPVR